jgi:murein L,D-transpeptidase YcbB/YkuD
MDMKRLITLELMIVLAGLVQTPPLVAAPTNAARNESSSQTVLPAAPVAQPEAPAPTAPAISTAPLARPAESSVPQTKTEPNSLRREATTSTANPTAALAPQPKAVTPETRSAAALAISNSPTFDEGSGGRIQEAIQSYLAIAARGGWQPIPAEAKFAIGTAGPHDELLRRRLVISGDLNPSEASGPYDLALAGAIRRFQARHGLATTGVVTPRTIAALNVTVEKRIQQLEASAKRIGAIGFGFGERYVVVNLPAAYAEAVENDHVVRRYRVVVGKTEKPSPTVTAEITEVNLNPTWTVPASITKNEIAAHMRKDATYLSRNHMQVLDAHDSIVDPETVDWSAGKTPNITVRQEAGPWNALGQVRVDMPNSYAVYMHDTNQKTLFNDEYRFDSHGCVRVDNVRDFVAWLLQDLPKWGHAEIDAAIATGQRHDIKLQKPVPVAWIYLTGWMSGDQIVQFRSDIYDQDQQLLEATAEEKAFFDQANSR